MIIHVIKTYNKKELHQRFTFAYSEWYIDFGNLIGTLSLCCGSLFVTLMMLLCFGSFCCGLCKLVVFIIEPDVIPLVFVQFRLLLLALFVLVAACIFSIVQNKVKFKRQLFCISGMDVFQQRSEKSTVVKLLKLQCKHMLLGFDFVAFQIAIWKF